MGIRDEYIWLRSDGCVIGMNLVYINDKIDQFNKSEFLRNNCCFWEWFSYEEGENYYGFSSLWNSNLLSKVHTIKGWIK